jgi:hypothetical protein
MNFSRKQIAGALILLAAIALITAVRSYLFG